MPERRLLSVGTLLQSNSLLQDRVRHPTLMRLGRLSRKFRIRLLNSGRKASAEPDFSHEALRGNFAVPLGSRSSTRLRQTSSSNATSSSLEKILD
ncbi:hypothetical protein BDQ12DRAFT_683655 [Crucibulum laeve]|uniref:Uncharacterized protein n=1 Tax=Crucibulum laeve TaxID=68775 RepID=A0A5C3LZA2_9AGAR|nr:hypothetical protein BDQ12DRAFT_683655 [Crucibulum laeve]